MCSGRGDALLSPVAERRIRRPPASAERTARAPGDDTASNLDPGDPTKNGFPQFGHGSIKLTVLFNNPAELE